MRLRSRNSRSMERGTGTSRPNRKRERFSRAEACSADRRRFNYALSRARGASEIFPSRCGDAVKRSKFWRRRPYDSRLWNLPIPGYEKEPDEEARGWPWLPVDIAESSESGRRQPADFSRLQSRGCSSLRLRKTAASRTRPHPRCPRGRLSQSALAILKLLE